jgi:ABC-2 type transport system ATP-binding protein
MSRLRALALVLSMLGVFVVAVPAGADEAASSTTYTVERPDGAGIVITVHKPEGATAANPAPIIFHSHGWGGSRSSGAGAFSTERGRGFGVVSIDQRGHGSTGGTAYVQHTEYEGQDIGAIIDFLVDPANGFDWIMRDIDEDGNVIPDDPVLFAIGGSYGGGYQLAGAFTEILHTGSTRFNALAPEITWYDLPRALAPEEVVRTAWVTLLYAAGANMHQTDVHLAFAMGAATGMWPDGTTPGPNMHEIFGQNSPRFYVEHENGPFQLDIPVLVRQGTSDNLFNLNEGVHIFQQALSDEAREQSIFVGYNGGHVLPNVLPAGYASGSDACTGSWSEFRLDFFEAVVNGENPREIRPDVHGYNLTTVDGECLRTDSIDERELFATGYDVEVTSGWMTTTGVGAPHHLEVAQGPITVAGIPYLDAQVTTVGADQRVFFALSVGETPATAQVVQNNMMPLRELLPIIQEQRTIELPGVAVEVPEGQSLYLTVSPISDMSFGHGSARTPGWVGLEDLRLRLPVVSG